MAVLTWLLAYSLNAQTRIDLFGDSFDNGLSQWNNVGSAEITDGRLRVPPSSELMRSNPSAAAEWDDFTLEAQVTIESVAAGLVFRAVDSGNFYMWQLSANAGRLRPHKKVGGSYSVLQETPFSFQTGVAYQVRIEADGPVISTYIDGELISTVTDPSFAAGPIGFRHGSTETSYYDDIEVYEIIPPSPTPPGAPAGFTGKAEWESGIPVAQLVWTPGEGAPDGFSLERRAEGEANFTPLAGLSRSATSFTDRWVQPGMSYEYRIAAFNLAGASDSVAAAVVSAQRLPLGYSAWAAGYWPVMEGGLPAESGWDYDSDGDGLMNGAEYAFGGDPLVPGGEGRLFLGQLPGYVRLLAVPFPSRLDIQYEVWSSNNLNDWSELFDDAAVRSQLLGENGSSPLALLDSDLSLHPRRWFRWNYSVKSEALTAPTDLLVNNLNAEMEPLLTQRDLRFGWSVGAGNQDDYQILVSSSSLLNDPGDADIWDSGWIADGQSIQISYGGPPLEDDRVYFWTVRTRFAGVVSPFTPSESFRTGALTDDYKTDSPIIIQNPIAPVKVVRKDAGHYFVDFGRSAFGTITLSVAEPVDNQEITVHLGESVSNDTTVNRNPGGTVRYRELQITQREGQNDYRLEIPTFVPYLSGHIPMPESVGEVMPFRYVELVNVPDAFVGDDIRQLATNVPFDEEAAAFESSDPVLNDVWELCKYSIKATTFTGLYVDGDRERKPYEADAYLNQLSHYYVDRDYVTGRLSHEYLLAHPTWPTEWKLHSIYMAWADYLYTGDSRSLAANYPTLQGKALLDRARADGLLSGTSDDIVDWPAVERDGYDMRSVKTAISAHHFHALELMAKIADVLEKQDDAEGYRQQAELVKASINAKLWDSTNSRYIDGMTSSGEVSGHSSIHANLFPLALGVVPPERVDAVVDFIKSRGMACSVYPAQYLLEALYEAGEDDHALSLMTSTGLRSWGNMIYNVGSTITLEAWDRSFKPNLDWNHAWGAAPANIIPRYILGVRPVEAGFGKMIIQPQPGSLAYASGKVPTIRGPVFVTVHSNRADRFTMEIEIPANTTAKVGIPSLGSNSSSLLVNGEAIDGANNGRTVWLEELSAGRYLIDRFN